MAMMVAVEVVIEIVVVKMEGVLVGVVEEMGEVGMELVVEEMGVVVMEMVEEEMGVLGMEMVMEMGTVVMEEEMGVVVT